MYTTDFWKAAAERSVKTIAQTALAVIGLYTSGLPTDTPAGIHNIDWLGVAAAAALAGVVSLLTSIGSGAKSGTPSLGDLEDLPGHAYIRIHPEIDHDEAVEQLRRAQNEAEQR
ncbi:holin [Nesterenkonia sp.]|uniref:holin n=1 Tax=Nesterenkonia sp. TaxID=704201 RepID=UPI00261D6629|nr:holin [Nesterenkonia sp.]